MVVIFDGTYPYVVVRVVVVLGGIYSYPRWYLLGDSYPGGIYPRVVVLQGSCLADYYPNSSYPGVVV